MRLILAGLLALLASSAQAGTSYLGTEEQDTNITGQAGALNVVSTNTVIQDGGNVISVDDAGSTLSIDDGGGAITVDGTVGITTNPGDSLAIVSTNTLNVQAQANDGVDIGDVTVNNAAGASAVNIQDGGNVLSVDDAGGALSIDDNGGSLTIDATQLDVDDLTFADDKVDASGSTLGANSGVDIGDVTINNAAGASAVNIQDGGNSLTVDATQLDVDDLSHTTDSVSLGDGTNTLGSSNTASGYALLVNDMNGPQIGSKSFTYASDNDMAATDTITITGLAKDVVLQALNGDCTFDIDGGNSIVVRKNTAEDFDFAFTLSSPTITLTAKDAAATCKARLTGVN